MLMATIAIGITQRELTTDTQVTRPIQTIFAGNTQGDVRAGLGFRHAQHDPLVTGVKTLVDLLGHALGEPGVAVVLVENQAKIAVLCGTATTPDAAMTLAFRRVLACHTDND